MTASNERIVNRNTTRPAAPRSLWLPTLLASLLFVLIALLELVNPLPEFHWVAGLYLALAVFYPFVAWSTSISWVDVGPERIVVRRPMRSQIIPMNDVVEVEAHRHWHGFHSRGKPPECWLSIRRASGWPRRLYYIQPDAGDRLLAAIHRFRKPIQVFNWT